MLQRPASLQITFSTVKWISQGTSGKRSEKGKYETIISCCKLLYEKDGFHNYMHKHDREDSILTSIFAAFNQVKNMEVPF